MNDFLREDDGQLYAGLHVHLDVYDVKRMDDMAFMVDVMERAVKAAGATILNSYFHHFTPNGGISGVLVLAESHISVHSWPERNFASFDIFMCGDADPEKAGEEIIRALECSTFKMNIYKRGIFDNESEA